MRYNYDNEVDFSVLRGKTLAAIHQDDARIVFVCDDGEKYEMGHSQDCCEDVCVESIVGDLNDLIGNPLVLAEERTSDENPPDADVDTKWQFSFTWTFYELATNKGSVTIRWYGASNGYYSESVELYRISEADPDASI